MSDQLPKSVSTWLDTESDKILPVWAEPNGTRKGNWIRFKYRALDRLGYSPETIYRLLRHHIEENMIEISDSYLRVCIRKESGIKRFARGAYYDHTQYLDFDAATQKFMEYVESGNHELDQIRLRREKNVKR